MASKITDIKVEPCVNSRYVQPFRVRYRQNDKERLWDCVKMHDSVAVLIFNKTRKCFVTVKQFRPAVYMGKNRALWESNPELFPTSLSKKTVSNEISTTSSSSSSSSAAAAKSSSPENPTKKRCLEDRQETSNDSTWGPTQQGYTLELCAGLVDQNAPLEQIVKEEILEETGYDVPLEGIENVVSYCSSIGTGGTQQQMFYCEVTDDMIVHDGGGNPQEGELIEVVDIPMEDAMKVVFDSQQPKSSGLCFAFCWFNTYKKHILINL